ncbi:MAG: CoA transferase [Pseudomonadota bacterium]
MTTPFAVLTELWSASNWDIEALDQITLVGDDPFLPSTYRVGAAALASIGATGLAAAELWRRRTGRAQRVEVDIRDAAATFRSERYLQVNGEHLHLWDPIAGFYQTAGDRWIQLHTNFPHHRAGVVACLGCADERAAVAAAILERNAFELEQELIDAGMCAATIRSQDEWRQHEQATALRDEPLIRRTTIDGAPPASLPADPRRPLEGIRVLDLSRIIAGPVAGRTLAEHGADVIRVDAPHLPNVRSLVIDTGRGKRSVHLDLRENHDAATFRELVRSCDVVTQAYRRDALSTLGFGPDDLFEMRPGLVHLSLNAFGYVGPWANRRGFDSLVQSTNGIAVRETTAAQQPSPRHLPCQALDHATGFLAAFAIISALGDRARTGGTHQLEVSLAQTAQWLDAMGRVDGINQPDLERGAIADLLERCKSTYGDIEYVRAAARMSETPGTWRLPPPALGADPPSWPAR